MVLPNKDLWWYKDKIINMTVTITLTTAGRDVNNCSLYSNVDGYVTPFATGVTRAQLLGGYTSIVVPNGTSTIRVKPIGTTCTNSLDITVITTTTTTTTAPIECYGYEVCADDGTGDRDAYPFTYTNCNGNVITSSVVNTQCREICAQRDSVDSSSGAIYITEVGPCL
jgi:hypothetical protein